MSRWVVILVTVLLTAVVCGLIGVAFGAVGVARTLFCVFLVMFVASLLIGLLDSKALERE